MLQLGYGDQHSQNTEPPSSQGSQTCPVFSHTLVPSNSSFLYCVQNLYLLSLERPVHGELVPWRGPALFCIFCMLWKLPLCQVYREPPSIFLYLLRLFQKAICAGECSVPTYNIKRKSLLLGYKDIIWQIEFKKHYTANFISLFLSPLDFASRKVTRFSLEQSFSFQDCKIVKICNYRKILFSSIAFLPSILPSFLPPSFLPSLPFFLSFFFFSFKFKYLLHLKCILIHGMKNKD